MAENSVSTGVLLALAGVLVTSTLPAVRGCACVLSLLRATYSRGNKLVADAARTGNDSIVACDGLWAGQETASTCVMHGGISGA